ncbi:MAG TPA: polysaccharide pyruvyl transferase family protein [Candidatus Eisenbergiella pullicola]|nr:polysaccharide pyruvyl transferase family protein [Candidatus Eisenbergiella pullicola]
MREDQIVLYMHAGSGNHGCEAIVNSLCKMLPGPAVLLTNRPGEDVRYSLQGLCEEIVPEKSIEKNFWIHAWYYAKRALLRDPECFMRYRYGGVTGKNLRKLNISIGGDNYCYDNMLDRLILSNRMFHRQGAKTVLLGCSIEPDLLKRPEILEDMRLYDAIIARESLTWQALLDAGIRENVFLCPDPAFLLETQELPLPEGWKEGKMLGLNVSPMIVDNESRPGITMENYRALLSWVLEHTDLSVALIPHVVWESNDDRKPLRQLYGDFRASGRVLCLEDASAPQLKGYISRCRMFIGARTHATIAAYSTCVPTLVVGYSVKALGIARDLFGTSDHYVLPVQTLERKEDLIGAFSWLMEREEDIRAHLVSEMPGYREKAKGAGELIRRLME